MPGERAGLEDDPQLRERLDGPEKPSQHLLHENLTVLLTGFQKNEQLFERLFRCTELFGESAKCLSSLGGLANSRVTVLSRNDFDSSTERVY